MPMTTGKRIRELVINILGSSAIILLAACSYSPQLPTSTTNSVQTDDSPTEIPFQSVKEVKVVEILLPEKISEAQMEFSGLAWYQNKLIMLPQYPDRLKIDGMGQLYAVEKDEIINYLMNLDQDPLEVSSVPFDDGGLSQSFGKFEGFEGIIFSENKVFLTIETRDGNPMMGYLVSGAVNGDLESVTLDPTSIIELPPQADFSNASDEAITIFDGKIYTIFEDNGSTQNSYPQVHVFDKNLKRLEELSFPNIEFRVTDATEVEPDGIFWVMNYFYPEDSHLVADSDPLAEKYGEGKTHQTSDRVERILQLRIMDNGIILENIAPIQFELLADGESRNWEGLVRLDDLGFIAITDKFPKTILGFCPD